MRTMTKEVSTQNKQRREVKFFGLFSLSFGSCSEHPKERNNNCGLKEDEDEALTAAEKEKEKANALSKRITRIVPLKSTRSSLSRPCECVLARASSPALSPRLVKLAPR